VPEGGDQSFKIKKKDRGGGKRGRKQFSKERTQGKTTNDKLHGGTGGENKRHRPKNKGVWVTEEITGSAGYTTEDKGITVKGL